MSLSHGWTYHRNDMNAALQVRKKPSIRPGGNVSAEIRRSVWYLCTGGVVYAIDFAIFFVLVMVAGLNAPAAQFLARSVGAAAGYFGHRNFTFRENRAEPALGPAGQWAGYVTVAVATIVASPLCIMIAMRLTGDRELLAKVMTEPLLIAMSYAGLRFVFRRRQDVVRNG